MTPHLIFLCSEYPPAPGGGIGTFYQTLARALVAQGWRVTVGGIYRDIPHSQQEDDHGVEVWRLPASPEGRGRYHLNMLRDRWRLGRWAARQRQAHTLIEAADYHGWSWGVQDAIVRLHGAEILFFPLLGRQPDQIKAYLEKKALQQAKYIVSSSQFMTRLVQPWLKPGQQVAATLYNMVDVDLFCPDPAVVRAPQTVASIANLTAKKGIFQLLAAWKLVQPQYPQARLLYYGRDILEDGGSNQSRLEAQAAGLQITLRGAVPYTALPQVFRQHAIYVFPSYLEAHPRAWLEAMATGAAVIGSPRGPGEEVIQQGVNGLLADPDDIPALAAQIIRLLANPAEAAQLGQAARQSMLEHYAIERILAANICFYEQCVS